MKRIGGQRRYREIIGIAVICAIVFTISLMGVRETAQRASFDRSLPYLSTNTGNSGTAALYRWLEKIGYEPTALMQSITDDGVLENVDALLLVGGSHAITSIEADALLAWVEAGGTFVYAPSASTPFLKRLGLNLGRNLPDGKIATLRAKIGDREALPSIRVSSAQSIEIDDRTDAVTHYAAEGDATIVSLRQGRGTIFVVSHRELFTNKGLRNAAAARVTHAIVRVLPAGARIAFDDFHNADITNPDVPRVTLFSEPWGWSLLIGLTAFLGYLLINGRAFGKPYPTRETIRQRGIEEFATSMASLYRRSNKRDAVLAHYKAKLKRDLGRPFRIQPDAPDSEFVEQLARAKDNLNTSDLIDLLRAMNARGISEHDLVKLARRAVAFVEATKQS